MSKITKQDIQDMLAFMSLSHEVTKDAEPDTAVTFTCPLCQGAAQSIKSSVNGHVSAVCEKCEMNIME